jgi:hypothetical protein
MVGVVVVIMAARTPAEDAVLQFFANKLLEAPLVLMAPCESNHGAHPFVTAGLQCGDSEHYRTPINRPPECRSTTCRQQEER